MNPTKQGSRPVTSQTVVALVLAAVAHDLLVADPVEGVVGAGARSHHDGTVVVYVYRVAPGLVRPNLALPFSPPSSEPLEPSRAVAYADDVARRVRRAVTSSGAIVPEGGPTPETD